MREREREGRETEKSGRDEREKKREIGWEGEGVRGSERDGLPTLPPRTDSLNGRPPGCTPPLIDRISAAIIWPERTIIQS